MLAYWVGEYGINTLMDFANGSDYGMSYVMNDAQFRFPIALQILFAIITLIGVLVLPESPRWVSISSMY